MFFSRVLIIIGLFFSGTTKAITLPAVPLEPIYFEPPVIERSQQIEQLSCVALDNTIRSLQPFRYTYKPSFFDDDANKLAATLIIVEAVPIVKGLLGVGYLGYSASIEEKEQRRRLLIEQQIFLLQQLKAEKQCFE